MLITESFTREEREKIAPFFTNVDRPVFAIVNLPETVKGALFARYSRYSGTLRRLFLDEFLSTLDLSGEAYEGQEGARAAALYERVFVGYGDDSIAQLGGAHLACEWCSNLLTKILQRPRLAAYLEQSTRYIAYDSLMPGGGYRYYRDAALGAPYERAMDHLFETYRNALSLMTASLRGSFPREDKTSEVAYERALRAKALDAVRGLLPAASLSHMGIFASGQTYEQLVLHLLAHPLQEARRYGEMMLEELEAVIPSFLARVRRPERGGEWITFLRSRAEAAREAGARLRLDPPDAEAVGPSVRLLAVHGSEEDVLVGLLYEYLEAPELTIHAALSDRSHADRARLLRALLIERANRRHRVGRGFERVSYRFEIVSDYGAFRDLQRHRLLTIQWQALSPSLGAERPGEIVEAGLGASYDNALERSAEEFHRLRDEGFEAEAPYALCLAFHIRYEIELNAREAMHLIELRSAREGHPSYRAVAQEMHRQIAKEHPLIAEAMTHVDLSTEPRLERLLSEIRNEARGARSPKDES